MSGFQIPGLGQAKPNEILPPLPPDLAAAAASAAGQDDLPDAPNHESANEAATDISAASALTHDSDTMVMDEPQPESPPSLTSALEAAIGGLGDEPQQQLQETAQAEPEMAELQNDTSEHPEWEIDSSPYESSSESSSDSSSSDSDNEGYELLGVEETARMLMEAEAGSDDEGSGGPSSTKTGSAAHMRTKNEVADDDAAVTRPDVTIAPDMKLEELGAVEHIVGTTALVAGVTPGDYQVLDAGSVLCTAERVVIGTVAETIGKVTRPMYTVRFNSAEEIAQLGLAVGTALYYTPRHATFVFTQPLKSVKGSDASNLYDEEPGDEELEFSDDEKEAEHKRSVKQNKKDKWKANNPEKAAAAAARAAARAKDHPLRQQQNVDDGALNYDDDEDGPYKPLARPSSLASGPGTSQHDQAPSARSGFQQGAARRGGDFRGRGRGGRGGRGGYSRGGGYNSNNNNNNQNNNRDGYSLPPQSRHHPYAAPPPGQGASGVLPQSSGAFGMQFPGWPPVPAPGAAVAPPPPPGWPGAAPVPPAPPLAPGQQGGGFNFDPAMIAAIMTQMQTQAANNGGQQSKPPG